MSQPSPEIASIYLLVCIVATCFALIDGTPLYDKNVVNGMIINLEESQNKLKCIPLLITLYSLKTYRIIRWFFVLFLIMWIGVGMHNLNNTVEFNALCAFLISAVIFLYMYLKIYSKIQRFYLLHGTIANIGDKLCRYYQEEKKV